MTKKTITWATLQQRIADGVVRQTELISTKGKVYAQLVTPEGKPLTVRIKGVLKGDS